MTSTLYDALVIGAGPAGLSVALGLSRVHRTTVVFTLPHNAGFRNEGVLEMHNVLSRDCTPPAEFRQIASDQIKKYGTTEFVETEITSVERVEPIKKDNILVPSHFEAVDTQGQKWKGKKLVLAMGSTEVLPTNIPGYRENWPHNIFQCLFCDGHERAHLPSGIIGFSPIHAHVAQMLNLLVTTSSGPPTVFSNGPIPDGEAMHKALETVRALGCKVDTGKIKNLEPAQAPEVGVTVVFEDGRQTKLGYLVDRPTTVLSGRHLIEKLGLEIEPHPVMGEHVKVGDFAGSTNVPGVFVVGDASTPLKAVANALSSGANAAAGIAQQLAAEELQRLLESSSASSL